MMPFTFPITLGLVLVVLGISAVGAWLLVLLFSLIWPPSGPNRGIKTARPATNDLTVATTRRRDDVVIDYMENRIARAPRTRPRRIAKEHESDVDDDRATREWPPAVRGGAAAQVFDRPVDSKARDGAPDDADSEVEF
ncbi:MAG: hypothetical protein JNL82_04335 [Myxococcales bacterium]|nr:hypothetical protein [Myxococcales bacterium]